MTAQEAIDNAYSYIERHRSSVAGNITCPEDCWCWDLEGILLAIQDKIDKEQGG